MRNLLSKFLFCPFKFNSKQLIHLEIYEKNEMKGNFGCFEKSPCALKLKKSWGPFVWLSPQKEKNFFFLLSSILKDFQLKQDRHRWAWLTSLKRFCLKMVTVVHFDLLRHLSLFSSFCTHHRWRMKNDLRHFWLDVA